MADLAQMLRLAGHVEEGDRQFMKMLASAKGFRGTEDEMRAAIETLVAQIGMSSGQPELGRQKLEEFLSVLLADDKRPRLRGRIPWSLAQFADNLYHRKEANVIKKTIMQAAAVVAADEAAILAKRVLPPDHLDIKNCQDVLDNLKKLSGRS